MKQNTKKQTPSAPVAPVETQAAVVATPAYSQLSHDLKTALLIVSVVANLFVFTGWVALQVTSQFDAQVSSFLFAR